MDLPCQEHKFLREGIGCVFHTWFLVPGPATPSAICLDSHQGGKEENAREEEEKERKDREGKRARELSGGRSLSSENMMNVKNIRQSSRPRNRNCVSCVSCIAGKFFKAEP